MPKTVSYDGDAESWSVTEFKSLVDALEVFHDPGSDQYVRKVYWNIRNNTVFVTLEVDGVSPGGVDSAVSTITSTLSGAPKSWPTDDERFSW